MARRSFVKGGAKLRRRLRRVPTEISAGVREIIAEESGLIHADAKVRMPAPGVNPYATGELRRKFRVRLSRDGFTARIGTYGKRRAAHGHLVEFGTAPHTIEMPDGQVLHHPGMKAQPFLLPAYAKRKRITGQRIAQAVRAALVRAGRP